MAFRRDAFVYVGVDVHKKSHVAVMVDSYGEQMGKPMKFDNSNNAFPAWIAQVDRRANGLGVICGLEDVHGLGRALATYLLHAGRIVKFANAYMTKAERDSVNKTDNHDALATARITAKHNIHLPDADIDPLQWALISTVSYRAGIVEEQTRIKNRLHNLLMHSWGEWSEFFSEPFDSKTAQAFWEKYPSAFRLRGVTVEELTRFLREQSHYAMGSKKAEAILAAVAGNREEPAFQSERDTLIRGAVRQLRVNQQQLADIAEQLSGLVAKTDYDLTHIPGIDVVMAAELISLVGDVTRFRNVDKFMAYTGIAPVTYGSGESETRLRSKFGRRQLLALFHRIACTQLVVHARTGEARNPDAKAYYEKCLGDQAAVPKDKRDRKVVKKALLSLMRAQAKRFYKLMKQQKQEAIAKRAGAVTEAPEVPEAA